MSNEKNVEVVGCDASIMRNVWEIRERDYGQKMQQEQERREKSALSSINKDWENRLAVRMGKGTRVERKPKRPEIQTDDSNVWKSKQSQAPPTLPRGVGSGSLGMPGGQRRGVPTAGSSKDKKVQDKNLIKLQLLMSITQNQPSAMVWGKSWKNNKSLPPPEEGAEATPGWGKCWMFATHQPYSEPGQPWLNGPNLMDPHNLHLWEKPDYRLVESEELDLNLATEEWQMSWRKADKKNKKGDTSSVNGHKSGFFTLLMETQHHYEALSSSEWSDSWRSTKPGSQQNDFTVHDDLKNESIAHKQDNNRKMSSKWEECWRLVNHYGGNKSKLPQVKKSHGPEWADSWRAAIVVSNNHKNSDPSLGQDHGDTYEDHSHQKESRLHEDMFVSHEQKYRDLYMQLCDEFKALSEWSKSWQVTKNNSKPSEEIEKILKLSPPTMEAQKVENNTKGHYSTSEKVDPNYEQLKHSVIYHSRREFTQSKLLHLKHLENVLSATEWRDSWKTLKHRMRMERRRMRPDPSRPFGASEKGGDMKPNAAELKDSWKFTSQPLHQEPESWQQGWPTIPQIRLDRAREQNHFAPVELPKNGPTGERSWGESWRFSRPQQQSQSGQGRAQTSQARSSMASQYPDNAQTHRSAGHRGHARSVSDWQDAWMFSETQFHHDKPSLTQWREAWKWSGFNIEHWTKQMPRVNEVDMLMEIQHLRERISLQKAQTKMSRSFDSQMFRERYPEKQWNASWRNGSLLNPVMPGKSMSTTTQQQHTTTNEHGSQWGMSFRIANPMPQVERPWVESSPNPCHHTVMWSSGKNIQNSINTSFSNNPQTFKLWVNSIRFLQGPSAQVKDKTKSKGPVDPRVIITKDTHIREHLYSNIDKDVDKRKWAGCHLLGKTQPRPKRGPTSGKNAKMDDERENFLKEWAESWRLLVQPDSLKQTLTGWNESWKFLIPPYQPMNGPKAR